MKALKKTGTIVLSVLLWVIILVAALYAFTTMATRDNQNVSNIMGYTPLVVKSDSMAPTFSAGDLIFIKKCDTSTLKEGDIICFHTIIDNEYALNTHRIEKIETVGDARSYTTLGDNNNGITDTHIISDGDIVGKYVGHLQNVGKVMDFLSSSMGFLIVIVLPMLLFFIYQVYNLIMISIRLKKAVAVEAAKEAAIAQEKAMQEKVAQEVAAKEEAQQNAATAAQEKAASESEAEAARAALEEAKRLREEAEAIRAQAEKELADAKKQQSQTEKEENTETSENADAAEKTESAEEETKSEQTKEEETES
ncbi:signal peptidase I [Blautia sp. MSJ-19]|uniref:signal peptidase I n=1 Tax=Blautia sp. MSJ-19 TaxID=2841517 RepID=UPI001C0F1E1C|nr:signal peptidase I [Blautia sp. MSJ-19]MBU5480520.1 signal peptidase I [Blautia sp. MSJ-19]